MENALMTEDIEKYIDNNGNFTHTKINGTKEQIEQIIQKYRDTRFYQAKTDSQKIIMEKWFFPEIIKTGMIPQGMLLELVMPSTQQKFKKFNEMEVGSTITFDLQPKYKQELPE
jgi:hypothetical protein